MSGTTSFRRLACDWWNARSGSGRPLTLRDALDLAEFAHAAGRRAGLEEGAGEAEGMEQDWLARNEKTYGELAVKVSESSPLRTLATTLRARAKKGRP
jgi:hypothetical protein